jgi:hypothetical protein
MRILFLHASGLVTHLTWSSQHFISHYLVAAPSYLSPASLRKHCHRFSVYTCLTLVATHTYILQGACESVLLSSIFSCLQQNDMLQAERSVTPDAHRASFLPKSWLVNTGLGAFTLGPGLLPLPSRAFTCLTLAPFVPLARALPPSLRQ